MQKPRHRLRSVLLFLTFFKIQRRTVYTVPQARFGGAIVKHVPQMATALLAEDFGAHHAVAVVHAFNHVGIFALSVKTWPSTMGVKLSVTYEEFGSATGTGVVSRFEVLVVDATTWIFGALLAKNAELLRGQFSLPLIVSLGDGEILGLHVLWCALA